MDKRPIGIFDSGVGGITVLNEIRKNFPNEDLIYLGDTKNFPYGDKSEETIIKIAMACTNFLISQDVKLIIIACGTATSQAIIELRKIYKIPIIGIITPTIIDIKKNIENNKTITIGVIATQGTIKSKKWQYELQEAIPQVNVISKACPLLAPMAEHGWIKNEVAKEAIKEYMKPFKENKIDKIILGCTHYPLFSELIRNELGSSVEIINTGEKIANYLKEYLPNKGLQNEKTHIGKNIYNLTDTQGNFIQVASILTKDEKIEEKIVKIDIE